MTAYCMAAAAIALGLLFLREIAAVVRDERRISADERARQATVCRLLSEMDREVQTPDSLTQQ